MATSAQVADAANDAMHALLKRIEAGAAPGQSSPHALAELALAYRYVRGGAQPGNGVVEK